MKQFLSVLALMCCSLISTAQISKGESFVTGSLGFNIEDDRNSFLSSGAFGGAVKITTFDGIVSYQYFILPRFSLGPTFGWSYRKAVFDELIDVAPYTFETVTTGFNRHYEPGLMVSYHIPITSRFNFYLTSSGRYIYVDQELQGDNDFEIQNGKGYIFDLRPGIYFFVTEKKKLSVRLEVGEIYFSKLYPENQPELFINEFNADFHPANFTLGAQFHFLRNTEKKAGKKERKKEEKPEKLTPLFDEN